MFEIFQKEIQLKPYSKGFHLITSEITSALPELSRYKTGLINIFLQHTSASLTINENADPTVRSDMKKYFERSVPDNAAYYQHNYEGSDDMSAHIKSTITGCELTVPVTNGRLNLGTWQGIYLCEHRDHGGSRRLVITIYGDAK
ncbi:MAG: YjbQ family protein [Ignavibacteriales bacterium]|nr:MAG: YjbQ family protein [Ignavibacteriales bacterium]